MRCFICVCLPEILVKFKILGHIATVLAGIRGPNDRFYNAATLVYHVAVTRRAILTRHNNYIDTEPTCLCAFRKGLNQNRTPQLSVLDPKRDLTEK